MNDADGELSEWVGADDYVTPVGIPVAAVSGVQGTRLLESIAAKKVTVKGVGTPTATEIFDIANDTVRVDPRGASTTQPTDLARIDTTYHGNAGELVGEFRYDYAPGVEYGEGYMLRTERGIERTEWVNTGEVEWYQFALGIESGWEVRGMRQAYEPDSVSTESWFSPIVRPYVGPGYWAPNRQGGFAQVNVPSWGDGGSAQHTGAFDIFSGRTDRSQLTEVWIDGELFASSPWQAASVFDLPDGETDWRVRNTATHDGTYLASSTETVSEWTFRSTGTLDRLHRAAAADAAGVLRRRPRRRGHRRRRPQGGHARRAGARARAHRGRDRQRQGHRCDARDARRGRRVEARRARRAETDAPSGPVDPGDDDFVE